LLAAARLQGVGRAGPEKSPQKSARKFLLGLAVPPEWTNEEWELLASAVRYHVAAEPRQKSGSFSRFSAEQQNKVRVHGPACCGLRARFAKCGVESGAEIRAEKSPDAIIIRIPGLADDVDTGRAPRHGKHLLEEYLHLPLVVRRRKIPGGPGARVRTLSVLGAGLHDERQVQIFLEQMLTVARRAAVSTSSARRECE